MGRLDPQGFELEKHGGQPTRFAALLDGGVIAAVFAFSANLQRKPPDDRMKEQQDLDDPLHDVDKMISATNVNQFVHEDQADFFLIERGEDRRRNQDHRLQPADHHWRSRNRALKQSQGPADSQLFPDGIEQFQPTLLRNRRAMPSQQLGHRPATGKSDPHDEDPDAPDDRHDADHRIDRDSHPGRSGFSIVHCKRRAGSLCHTPGIRHEQFIQPELDRILPDNLKLRGPLLNCRVLNATERKNRPHEDQQTGEHRKTRHQVTSVRRTPIDDAQHNRCDETDQGPLPEKVQKSPPD